LEPAFEWHLPRRRTPRAARHVSVASARRSRPAWRPRRRFARLRRAGSRIGGAAAPHLLLFAPVVGATLSVFPLCRRRRRAAVNRLFECCTGYDAIEVLGKNRRVLALSTARGAAARA
jgi:hypothetical protein